MNRKETVFLRWSIYVIGLIVLVLCLFWLPKIAQHTAEMYPEYSYLQFPTLICLYVTTIPFFIALYKALKLLHYIDYNEAFSENSVSSLKHIKYCAYTIAIIYIIGSLTYMMLNALHPGIAIIALIIIFASFIIAIFASVLQKLLNNALVLKTENELTI